MIENDFPPYPCPCCGYIVFSEQPGSYAICPICFWEDDGWQLSDFFDEDGANSLPLYKSQQNYLRVGACEERFLPHVRSPLPHEIRDKEWRVIDMHRDDPWVESEERYYWRRV
jgi:Cysteine-rich CPCC